MTRAFLHAKLAYRKAHFVDYLITSCDYDDRAELRDVKAQLLFAYCITLVVSPQQMALAQAAGADQVLLKGFSTQEFFKILQTLPSKHE